MTHAVVVDRARSRAWDGSPAGIGVVVATYERPQFLRGLVDSLEGQDLGVAEFQVVIVDNGSSDDTWERLRAIADATPLRMMVVRVADNRGPAGGRNAGVASLDTPIIAVTDDDCLPTPAWLRELHAAFDTEPAMADPAGRQIAIVQGAVHPDPRHVDAMAPWDHTKSIRRPTPFFETCNVAYRAEAFHAAGGFDEDDPLLHPPSGRAFGEDACLAWEILRDDRAESAFSAGALVHHRCLPGTYRRWLADQRELAGFPGLARRSPLIADWLHRGVFLDRRSELFDVALVGVAAAVASRRAWPLVAVAPWARNRLRHARALAGPPAQTADVLARLTWSDAVAFAAMARGSIRHRRLVI